ncbi:CrcB family protein [Actinosynnema sp. NPDC050436]|uniref:fluoride efflux transporter FluC n=1 Tax=Actinosynnema sp. NPDC050436 TaxID=3155659 RepID=UPI00340020BE
MPVEPVDPDAPVPGRALSPAVLAAIALGGGLGGLARHAFAGLGVVGTVAVNVLGSALIGVLMALLPRLHPLARPLLGVGFLGGFTTFSAHALDVVRLGPAWGAAYLVGTLVGALAATACGLAVTRRVAG